MATDISLFWLTLQGMGATVFICAFIIGLARLVQVFFKRMTPDGSMLDEEGPPIAAILSAAVKAMQEDTSARLRPSEVRDSSWAAGVRLESSRFEGGPVSPE